MPADAKVFVNGSATSSTGTNRQYISRSLNDGSNYTYEVRAEVVRNGQIIEETKSVNLRAGDNVSLAFDLKAKTETSVTVKVPSNAQVTLAGHITSATGRTRTFTTAALEEGAEWDDYTVLVTYERDGRTLTQEQTITLKAGESRTLEFDFDAAKIADAR